MTAAPPPVPGPEPVVAPARALVWTLLAVSALPFLLGLGDPPLWDANEPFYVEPAKEALTWASGSLWAPTWNGSTYLGHPPLATWAVALSYRLFGIDEATGRFPGALAAVALVFATYALGRALGGRRTGLLAGLVLAATPRVWLTARELAGDILFTLLLTGAAALSIDALERGRRGRMLLGHALLGLAVLTKGPLALLLHVPVLLLVAWRSQPRRPLRALAPGGAALIVAAVAGPWFVGMVAWVGSEFVRTFLGWHNFGRFFGLMPSPRSPFFYLGVLPADAQPWILLLPLAARSAWRVGDRRPAALWPWLGMGWMLLVLSASAGKRNVYLLPLYPLLAVAVAPALLAAWTAASRALPRVLGSVLGLTAWGAAAAFLWLERCEPLLRPEVRWPVAVLAAGGGALLVAALKGSGRMVVTGALATVLVAQGAAAAALPALSRVRPVPRLAAEILRLEDPRAPEPAIVFRARITSLSWYLGRAVSAVGDRAGWTAAAGGAPRVFVLCPEPRLGELAAAAPEVDFVERARGPMLDLQFSRVVLGRREPVVPILLMEGRLRTAGGPPGDAPVRSPGKGPER